VKEDGIDAELIAEAGRLWNSKAEFWDELMGDAGNRFYREMVAPAQMALLDLKPTDVVLEVACGNGVATRDVARIAGRVVACDVSPRMIEAASRRADHARLGNIDFHVLDATDAAALASLGEGVFDALLCSMALMDIPLLEPLMRAAPGLLKPGGRFVFSMNHPSFNQNGARMVEELEDRDGVLAPTFSMKITQYLDVPIQRGVGARGEPESHYYFHRPLSGVLQSAFAAGLVLDRLEEPAFPKQEFERRSFSWSNYSQIPPILVGRLRPLG
jgi:SAM-dependent methyltransferase